MTTTGSPPLKPLLRGWSHAVALIVSVPLTVALVVESQNDLPRQLSMLVYGLSMIALFAGSAAYHLGSWQDRSRQVMRALDHANIFILIAGTYTPICVNVLSDWLRPTVLVLIWGLAAVGVTCSVLTLALPRWATVTLYLGMGWVAIIPAPILVQTLPGPAVAGLLGGGLLYTLGSVVYAQRWPDPFPRIFGFHEVFHLFVIAGSAAFLTVIWVWVLPFPRA